MKHISCVGPFGGAALPMKCDKNGQMDPEAEDCGACTQAVVHLTDVQDNKLYRVFVPQGMSRGTWRCGAFRDYM